MRKTIALCGSCLAVVLVPAPWDGTEDRCSHCGAKDEEGPCPCGDCRGALAALLAGEPYLAYNQGTPLHGLFWQRGVNWSRRGIQGEPVGREKFVPYTVRDEEGCS